MRNTSVYRNNVVQIYMHCNSSRQFEYEHQDFDSCTQHVRRTKVSKTKYRDISSCELKLWTEVLPIWSSQRGKCQLDKRLKLHKSDLFILSD